MKLTIAEIFNVKEPLGELAKKKLPVKTSFAILKLIRKLDEHLIPAEGVKNNLVKQYGSPPEGQPNSEQISIKPGDVNFPKFAEEFSELIQQEVEIVCEKVVLPETLEIEPAVLMALEKFVKLT